MAPVGSLAVIALVVSASCAEGLRPEPADIWGPLAVRSTWLGQDARTVGTLSITDRCVTLETRNRRVLLIWPAPRTEWRPDFFLIRYATSHGDVVELRDGDEVVLGGGGGSADEGSELHSMEIRWVAPPNQECPVDAWWTVSDAQVERRS